MRTALHTLACAGAVLVGAAPPGTAQIGVGAGVIYLSPAGVDFRGTDAGPGLDGQLRFSAGSHLSFGLGAQWSRHGAPSLNSHFTVLAIFAEPRFAIPVPPSAVQPYVAARVGYAHERIVAGGTTYHADGRFYGAGGGLLFRVRRSARIDLSLLFGPVHFGDFSSAGGTLTGSRRDGSALLIRGGVVVGRAT
ncbi:MAG TPA: hypothetical protein VFI79_19230 [Gemmatimonadales bacterium]|nr:hypothetical protein [Gemmatimonadales bacterium]